MTNSRAQVPNPVNEPVLGYAPGSTERALLEKELDRVAGEKVEIPCIIGGTRVKTGKLDKVVMPHEHGHVLAEFHCAGKEEVAQAIRAAADAKREWANMPFEARAAVMLKASELLVGKWRMRINATTMHGQSKTCHQAEIDAACEMIDFLRYNVQFAQELYENQPNSTSAVWNRVEYRALEGFILAVTPFNFTSIAANLCAAPALMGNTVLWKPAESQTLSAYEMYLLFEEAGLPPGVINFLPGDGKSICETAMGHKDFAGLHFTGSTHVFRALWAQAGQNIEKYRSYPRLVGETGGKDFIVAHPSADPDALVAAIVRGGYEYQGQKCSAASRIYVAESVWKTIQGQLTDTVNSLTMGSPRDFRNFVGAVIKQNAFDRHEKAIANAKSSQGVSILAGGECDSKTGWFVRPTLLKTDDPHYQTMEEELFGPIVSLHVFPDARFDETLEIVDQTSPYALTGAVFANDRRALEQARVALQYSAGNFYFNDKPTGAVVGNQPFGGSRASGTNDKAGAHWNLLRWVSPRTMKETLAPPTSYKYPFLG